MSMSRTLISVLNLYQATHDKAFQIYSLYEAAESTELHRLSVELGKLATETIEQADLVWKDCGALGRHLTFLNKNLKENNKHFSAQDIDDILHHDLPQTLKSIISKVSEGQGLDQKLKDSVYPLLDGCHYDSAIRKAFVVLTERLRRSFEIVDKIDGDDLVNRIFGGSGLVELDANKKQAYRNLISGFYGVYRNKYSHNDEDANQSNTAAILEMVNQIIIEIEELSQPPSP